MISVKLPKADWQWILMLLEDKPGYVSDALVKDLEPQVYKKEN
jgi:hypothetical protein